MFYVNNILYYTSYVYYTIHIILITTSVSSTVLYTLSAYTLFYAAYYTFTVYYIIYTYYTTHLYIYTIHYTYIDIIPPRIQSWVYDRTSNLIILNMSEPLDPTTIYTNTILLQNTNIIYNSTISYQLSNTSYVLSIQYNIVTIQLSAYDTNQIKSRYSPPSPSTNQQPLMTSSNSTSNTTSSGTASSLCTSILNCYLSFSHSFAKDTATYSNKNQVSVSVLCVLCI